MSTLQINTWYQYPILDGFIFYYFNSIIETEPNRWFWDGNIVECLAKKNAIYLNKQDFFFNQQPNYDVADTVKSDALSSLITQTKVLQDIIYPPSL